MSECPLCHQKADFVYDLTFYRANHGGLFGACELCFDALKWHSENTQQSRCVVCAEEGCKDSEVTQMRAAGDDLPEYTVNWCSSCYQRLEPEDEPFIIRGRANIAHGWDVQRKKALLRDSMECVDCGYSDGRLHVHHEIPQSEGGTDDLRNLKTVCPDCHADAHDTDACEMCGSVIHTDGFVVWTDERGGTFLNFCDECKSYIRKSGTDGSRCSVCARVCSPSKSCCIFLSRDPDAKRYRACDKCREKIIFATRGDCESYLDEQLPDSHVDVRHWESAASLGGDE